MLPMLILEPLLRHRAAQPRPKPIAMSSAACPVRHRTPYPPLLNPRPPRLAPLASDHFDTARVADSLAHDKPGAPSLGPAGHSRVSVDFT